MAETKLASRVVAIRHDCLHCGKPMVGDWQKKRYCSVSCRQAVSNAKLRMMEHYHEHEIWRTMRYRCGNPLGRDYYRYGGRGIKVCERWQRFENFYADMGPRPDGYTIERMDNDGNYEPSNCMWAPQTDQNRNKRNTYTADEDRQLLMARMVAGKSWEETAVIIGKSPRSLECRARRLVQKIADNSNQHITKEADRG